MTRVRGTEIISFLARALLLVFGPAVLSAAACNSDVPTASSNSAGVEPKLCKVSADCSTGGSGGPVCLLGYCENDPSPCTTPCTGRWLGYTCVHSGVQAHCDGCKYDSACLPPLACQTVTGHPCSSDLDGGWAWGTCADAKAMCVQH
jgi:hypothetical protein